MNTTVTGRKTEDLILVVDDIQRNLQIVANFLEAENFRLSFAENGEQALKMVSRTLPDLILLDIMMPGMDGFEVCRRLKASPGTRDIPIIFLTGRAESEDLIKGFEIGGVDYVTKPFKGAELLARIKTHLELKHAREALKEKNEQITASIYYAERIQGAILPLHERIDSALAENFIIFKPKDIVSGDFYWFEQFTGKIVIAVVDCTGHGVPGAFMSMIGSTLLNKIVIEQKVLDPAQILERLDIEVRKVLKQDQTNSEVNEGMDVCLCLIEKEKSRLTFAGAMRPLYIMREQTSNGQSGVEEDSKLIEIKGDMWSIGGKQRKKESKFTNKEIAFSPGDMIYLTSDGYMHQNNSENKKIGSSGFKNILEDIAGLEIDKQKGIILKKLAEHQGEENQRDDILLIGVRL
ncbi:MAG: response regulator [Candidatus Aminicenantes bacterium]|nr:response regulator [Candidatus Aminicenantes bacterium]